MVEVVKGLMPVTWDGVTYYIPEVYAGAAGPGPGSGAGSGDADGSGGWDGYESGYSFWTDYPELQYWFAFGNGSGEKDGSKYAGRIESGVGSGKADASGGGYGLGCWDGSGLASWNGACICGYPPPAVFAAMLGVIPPPDTVLAYWVSNTKGRPSNGGTRLDKPAAPGVVHRTHSRRELVLCRPGTLHGTANPYDWRGRRLWLVALHEPIIWDATWDTHGGEKLGSRVRTILCEIKGTP